MTIDAQRHVKSYNELHYSFESALKDSKSTRPLQDREVKPFVELLSSGQSPLHTTLSSPSSRGVTERTDEQHRDELDDGEQPITEASRLLLEEPLERLEHRLSYPQFSQNPQYQREVTRYSDIDITDLKQLEASEWYHEVVATETRGLMAPSMEREVYDKKQLRTLSGTREQLLSPLIHPTSTTSSLSHPLHTTTSRVPPRGSSVVSLDISDGHPTASCKEQESLWCYIIELITHISKSNTIRGKQSRLTMWELLEHFDFLNDLFFICRVGMLTRESRIMENPFLQKLASISILYLTCIWLLSAVAYGTRGYIIYHRIAPEHRSIFYPVCVFSKIREVGDPNPSTLYMFERLCWTYELVIRIFEDIPQLLVSATFLANFGQDFYTYFMISYSCTLMVITSVRMSLTYPLFRTLSLILSQSPPVDSPTLIEASPTTRNFALFVAINFALWSGTNALCLCFAGGIAWWALLFLSLLSAALSLFFLIYWVHLHRQHRMLNSLESVVHHEEDE